MLNVLNVLNVVMPNLIGLSVVAQMQEHLSGAPL
jgi:hypothetical protein